MQDIVIHDEDVRRWKAELVEAERRCAILRRLLDGVAAYYEWQEIEKADAAKAAQELQEDEVDVVRARQIIQEINAGQEPFFGGRCCFRRSSHTNRL